MFSKRNRQTPFNLTSLSDCQRTSRQTIAVNRKCLSRRYRCPRIGQIARKIPDKAVNSSRFLRFQESLVIIKKPDQTSNDYLIRLKNVGGGAENRTPVHTRPSVRLYKLIRRSGLRMRGSSTCVASRVGSILAKAIPATCLGAFP